MATAIVPEKFQIRLLHDCILGPADEPRGQARYGKAGQIVDVPREMPRWEAWSLVKSHAEPEQCRAEVVTPKGK